MNQHSEDGGLLLNPEGYIFSASDSLVGGFREATLALEVGDISDVVETDYGYHIILCTDELSVPAGGYTSVDQIPRRPAVLAAGSGEQQCLDLRLLHLVREPAGGRRHRDLSDARGTAL